MVELGLCIVLVCTLQDIARACGVLALTDCGVGLVHCSGLYIARACGVLALTDCGVGLVHCSGLYIARACGVLALTDCGVGLVHCSLCLVSCVEVTFASPYRTRRNKGGNKDLRV